jgi:hypothetical protein
VVSRIRQTVFKQMPGFLYSVLMLITNYSTECTIWGSHSGGYDITPYHHHWQKCLISAIAFLRRFCQIASGFHFFGFRNSNSFTEQSRQPRVQPPAWRTRSLYLYPPVTGWVRFSSPSTTRRDTVEVFQPASTRRITLYSTFRVNRRFEGTRHLLSRLFLAWHLRPWRWRLCIRQKRLLTRNEVHGVVSQRLELCFI